MSPRKRVMVLSGVVLGSVLYAALGGMAQEPRSAEDFVKRGTARRAVGDLDGAIQDFTIAIALNSHSDARVLKGTEGSDKYMVMDRFNANACFHRGVARLKQGDVAGAIRDFDKMIAYDPKNSEALNNRGVARMLAQDFTRAIEDYDRAIRMNPRNAAAHNNRGLVLHEIEDHGRAVAAYSRAIEIDPEFAAAYSNRGSVYEDQGDHERAFRDCDRAIALDPSLNDAYLCRGVELIFRGKDKEAEEDFALYLRRGGEMRESQVNLVQNARNSRKRTK